MTLYDSIISHERRMSSDRALGLKGLIGLTNELTRGSLGQQIIQVDVKMAELILTAAYEKKRN